MLCTLCCTIVLYHGPSIHDFLKDIVCYVQTLKSLSTNITKLKEAATTIKKRADTAKEDQTKKQPSIDAADLRKKADALRKEVQ